MSEKDYYNYVVEEKAKVKAMMPPTCQTFEEYVNEAESLQRAFLARFQYRGKSSNPNPVKWKKYPRQHNEPKLRYEQTPSEEEVYNEILRLTQIIMTRENIKQ